MKCVFHSGLAVVCILAALAPLGGALGKENFPELPHFHSVNRFLFRGGLPREGGIQKLKELGIRTVVNLRGEDERSQAEEAAARAMGLRYFNFPMSGLEAPADEQIFLILALINDRQNWPVFVHCKVGAERTVVVVACFRIAHDEWSAEQAIQEALHRHLRPSRNALLDYIRGFEVKIKAMQFLRLVIGPMRCWDRRLTE